MNRWSLPALPVFACLLACSSGDPGATTNAGDFPAQALTTLASDSGKLSIEVRTSPEQPPSRGEMSVQFVVRNATGGAPAAGLGIAMTPWMPVMDHGTSTTPDVSETAPGVYVVNHVALFMPGTWQLRTDISGPLVDHVAPSLQIP